MDFVEILWNVLFFLVIFLIVYFFTYCMNLNHYKKKKYKKINEYNYLTLKFHLPIKGENLRKMLISFSLIDAFIIAFVTTVITLIPIQFIWQLLIGFVLLFFLIYVCYEIYGKYLMKKRKEKENEL